MSLPTDPTEFNKPAHALLADTDVDGLGQAVLTLCHELWIMKDRMAVMEAVLEKHDINISEEIDAHQPDQALQDKLNKDGRALVERVMAALSGS